MNTMYFTPDDVKAGLMKDLINYLTDFGTKSKEVYMDIHISTDSAGYCTIVEWEPSPFSGEWGGSFKFVDEDQCVATEVRFPDSSYAYAGNEEEVKELWDNWVNNHPNWTKDNNGRWINKDEVGE